MSRDSMIYERVDFDEKLLHKICLKVARELGTPYWVTKLLLLVAKFGPIKHDALLKHVGWHAIRIGLSRGYMVDAKIGDEPAYVLSTLGAFLISLIYEVDREAVTEFICKEVRTCSTVNEC